MKDTQYQAIRTCGRISASVWSGGFLSDEDRERTLAEWRARGDTVEIIERPRPEGHHQRWIFGCPVCDGGECVRGGEK